MSDDRKFGPLGSGGGRGEGEQAGKSVTSSRARNRTVMLTPEMTGQVRALLYNEESSSGEPSAPETAPTAELRPDPINDIMSSGGSGWSRPERADPQAASQGFSGPAINDFAPVPSAEPQSSSFGGGFSSGFEGFSSPPKEPSQTRNQAFGTPTQTASSSLFQPNQAHSSGGSFGVGQFAGSGTASGMPGVGRGFGGVSPSTEAPSLGIPRKDRSTRRFGNEEAPAAHPEPGQVVSPQPQAQRRAAGGKVIGFLISFDNDENGEAFDIRSGRLLITCRPTDQGDFILIDHPTVSPLHAIIRATKEGKVEVLDQLSEYGTGIIRSGEKEEMEVAGARMALQHGDVLRFGERRFVVCLVPVMQRPAAKDTEVSLKEGEGSLAE